MALATKRLLADSLKELLERKTLDKITVKEIVEHCGVNRQTFYYNFQDIYDLIEWIFNEEAERLLGDRPKDSDWKEDLHRIVNYLKENENLVWNVMRSVNRVSMEQFLKAEFTPTITEIVHRKTEGKNVSQENIDFIVNVYTLSAVGLLFNWLDEGLELDCEEKLNKLICLLDGSLEYAIDKLGQESAD